MAKQVLSICPKPRLDRIPLVICFIIIKVDSNMAMQRRRNVFREKVGNPVAVFGSPGGVRVRAEAMDKDDAESWSAGSQR